MAKLKWMKASRISRFRSKENAFCIRLYTRCVDLSLPPEDVTETLDRKFEIAIRTARRRPFVSAEDSFEVYVQ